MSAQQIIQAYLDGLIRQPEMHQRLDALKIRGSWAKGVFTAYDYARQCWLRFDLNGDELAA